MGRRKDEQGTGFGTDADRGLRDGVVGLFGILEFGEHVKCDKNGTC